MKKRPAMIASVVRDVVSPLLRECPQACGIVSLTDIEVSDDVGYATCYISALQEPEQAIAFLQSRIPVLKKGLGAALQMHRAPFLRFRIDPRTERGSRIDKLLEGGK
ncbi:MAG: ribosome-binding factor A [Candidatus Peribacteraceae bacterium]|nr:ribosome-binding factor A [Candidatus Peribacteraceae bacterium]